MINELKKIKETIENDHGVKVPLICFTGSYGYGLYQGGISKDVDIMGFFVRSLGDYVGIESKNDKIEMKIDGVFNGIKIQFEITMYDGRKFFSLCSSCNPTVLQMLYVDREFLLADEICGELFANRHIFISEKYIKKNFGGTAIGFLNKAKNYSSLKSMNDGRRKRIERHGYDTKSAMHAVRVARLYYDLLVGGYGNIKKNGIEITRKNDRQELIDIYNGKKSIDDIDSEVKGLISDAENKNKNDLPAFDDESIEELRKDINDIWLNIFHSYFCKELAK